MSFTKYLLPQQFRRAASIFNIGSIGILGAVCLIGIQAVQAARYDGELTLSVLDEQTHEPLAVRFELRDARGRLMRVRAENAVATDSGVYFDGEVTLKLRRGNYSFLIEAGPEYRTRPGNMKIDRHAEDAKEVTILRRVDMQSEGWLAGDLDVSESIGNVPLLMRARGVDFAPVIVESNLNGKCKTQKLPRKFQSVERASPAYGPWAQLDLRRGGGLALFGQEPAPELCKLAKDDSSLALVNRADNLGIQVVALEASAWDLPIWVAAGKLDGVQILNRFCSTDDRHTPKSSGRPLDRKFFPGKRGPGRWNEAIYHHLLNCGLRIPPAAGSGCGAGDSPIGLNRVYAQCGEDFSRKRWLDAFAAGKVVVTNGPLLRTRVSGHPPGHVFQLEPGETREFQIALDLAFYEKTNVEYLDILKDGRSLYEIRLDELAARKGRLPPVEFDGSGWFLVRAVTDNTEAYQYATTGPYYVESSYQPRISRKSVQFFLDWLDDAAKEFAGNQPVEQDIAMARSYWEDLLKKATDE